MLLSLFIKNFVTIKSTEVYFSPGLSVITGDTGVGKSLILDALLFCLGHKIDCCINESNITETTVTAEFKVCNALSKILVEHDIDNNGIIIITAKQKQNSKKRIFVNDRLVTHALIYKISFHLMEVYSQNNLSDLLKKENHINILDEYGSLKEFRSTVQEAYNTWQNCKKELDSLTNNISRYNEEISYLENLTQDLKNVNINLDEEKTLIDKRIELQKKHKKQQFIRDTLGLIQELNFSSTVLKIEKSIYKKGNGDLLEIVSLLDKSISFLEEAKSNLEDRLCNKNYEYELSLIEDKLFSIKSLSRKYYVKTHQLNELYLNSITKLNDLKKKVNNINELKSDESKLFEKYITLSKELSRKRKTAKISLEEKINDTLEKLDMPDASFQVKIDDSEIDYINKNGIDQVSFFIKTNLGMDFYPLEKSASGGELSRIMLAIKTALFKVASKSIIVFDEIDVGLSGKASFKVGNKLKFLSQSTQVIVITHNAQIARQATEHFLVYKKSKNNTTYSCVKKIQGQDKINEVARMICGVNITSNTLKIAEELLHAS